MGSSRAAAPAPLSMERSSGSSSSYSRRTDSFGSDYSDKYAPRSSTNTWSSGSSKPSSPTVNVHTHCGRHTDQYLFGGRSMSDLVRSAFKKE